MEKKIIIKFKEYETDSIDIEEDKIKEIANEMLKVQKFTFNNESNIEELDNKIILYIPNNFEKFEINEEKRYEVDRITERKSQILSYREPYSYEENNKLLSKLEVKYCSYEENEIFRVSKKREKRENEDVCKIVIVLESPHREEYENSNYEFKPLGPAMKKTGNKIEKYIINLIKCIETYYIANKKYDIYLINPVKFQASLGSFYNGKLNENIRNNLWKAMYIYYKEEFLKHITEYDFVVNCCSEIESQFGKKQITNDLLNLSNRNFHIIESNRHPAYWHLKTKLTFIDVSKKAIYLNTLNEVTN